MRHHQFTLTARDVQRHAADQIQQHIPVADYSKRCPATLLLHIVFTAVARLTSIFSTVVHLQNTPSCETIRKALLHAVTKITDLEGSLNNSLIHRLPRALRQGKQVNIAIDLHLVPYYGSCWQSPKEIYRSKAKDGTCNFHAYASACLLTRGQRFTVALIAVERGEKMNTVVKRLMRIVQKAKIQVKLVLLDAGFYSIDVVRYLQSARIPFIMPAVARGRRPPLGTPLSGIRAFQRRNRSGWERHQLVDQSRKATVLIAIHCGKYTGRRRGNYAWVFAYWGVNPSSTRWVAETYRKRFGIETSYRQLNQGRINTCSRHPKVRYFFIALALLLRNVWVWLHWMVLASPRRGGRRLKLARLTFKRMLQWLQQVAEIELGVNTSVDAATDMATRT